MNKNTLLILVASFVAGAVVMLFFRAPKPPPKVITSAQGTPAAESSPPHADHEDTHENHDAHDPPPTAPPSAQGPTKMYTCADDPSVGLSYAGKCPLDGSDMVEAEVDLSKLVDLKNKTCPIMGGDAKENIFAIYKGKKINFCCPGCDTKFFESAEEHLKKFDATPSVTLTEAYVCAADSSIGLSYAGKCPLDGSDMIKAEVDLSKFIDLKNKTCPVMGGAAQENIFAFHHDRLVHFCCPGCGETFFSDTDAHFKKLESTSASPPKHSEHP